LSVIFSSNSSSSYIALTVKGQTVEEPGARWWHVTPK